MHSSLEIDHLARKLIDAPGDIRIPAEEIVLDLIDVVLKTRNDGAVLIDDLVQDRVEHCLWPHRQQAGVSLQACSHASQVRRLCMADGHNEVGPDKDVKLAELNPLLNID